MFILACIILIPVLVIVAIGVLDEIPDMPLLIVASVCLLTSALLFDMAG